MAAFPPRYPQSVAKISAADCRSETPGRHRGLPLCKALEDGEFRWPKVHDGVIEVDGCTALGPARRARLAASPRGAPDPHSSPGGLTPRRSESAWIPLSWAVGEYGLIGSCRFRPTSFPTTRMR